MLEFGAALPGIRDTVRKQLGGRGLRRERVLATAVRLIDLGFFRDGSEEYAAENGTFGLATIRREHVRCGRDELTFEYPAKGSIQREQAVADELSARWSGASSGAAGAAANCWPTGTGRAAGGHDVTAADINEYLREISGGDFTAKDFRTWNATVLAAVGLAVSEPRRGGRADPPAGHRPGRPGGGRLPGNTPAVARASYIDPRVIDRYEHGVTISSVLGELGASSEFGELATEGRPEAAVLRLLRSAPVPTATDLRRSLPGRAGGRRGPSREPTDSSGSPCEQ